MLRPSSILYSTQHSSGTVARRIWSSRLAAQSSPEAHVAEQLKGIPGYREAFEKAFPGESNPITLSNVQKAIAAFEATLITPNAPLDQFLRAT